MLAFDNIISGVQTQKMRIRPRVINPTQRELLCNQLKRVSKEKFHYKNEMEPDKLYFMKVDTLDSSLCAKENMGFIWDIVWSEVLGVQ